MFELFVAFVTTDDRVREVRNCHKSGGIPKKQMSCRIELKPHSWWTGSTWYNYRGQQQQH